MKPIHCTFPLLIVSFSLSSCDSLKDKAVTFLDEKIEETSGQEPQGDEKISDREPSSPDAVAASSQKPVRQISDSDYDAFTKIAGHVVVVDFYADWCGPCRRLAPILDAIVADHGGKVLLGKMDVDKNKQVPAREGVRGIPDVRIFVNGKQVDKFVGLPPEKVARQKIETHLSKLGAPAPAPAPKPEPKPQAKPEPKAQPNPKPEEEKPPEEEPKIKPMDKDWLPPGVQRKGT